MLANLKSQNLVDHLKAVSYVAQEMSRICGYSKRLQRLAYTAGLLHDVGKATKSFQNYLSTGQTDEEAISPMHHEISWAFLIKTYGISDDNYLMFNAVYWHHARPLNWNYEYLKFRDEVIEKIKDSDFKRISMHIQSLELPDWNDGKVMDKDESVPALFSSDSTYNKNTNAEMLAVRMCLISADRLVSEMSADEVAAIAQGAVPPSPRLQNAQRPFFERIPCPAEYQLSRFNLQSSCAKEALKTRTTIVKAPAGYGKTLIGILYTLLQGKQSYWVCPRNIVAEAVYENIIREISALNINCSIELYLSGERKKANTAEGCMPDFSSDIVVTNIDNLLGPMVNNRTAKRLFDILSGVVILDEFHEFASDSPLFAAFVTYMRARHRLSSTACTLLLSATPLNMHKLWDTDHLTTLLPDKEHHYPAAHEGSYHTDFIKEFPEQVKPASLCVFNSVSRAQNQFVNCQMEYLVHSRFTDADRQKIMVNIYSAFGKAGTGVLKGESVSSAPVIQAAMDISLVNLYDSVCSPETTLQRIGRCNRWGTYDDRLPAIFLYVPDLKSLANERGAIDTIYNRKLRDLWVQYLQKKITGAQPLTLKAWYEIYNSFYAEHGRDVWGFLREQYKSGLDNLIDYYPVKLMEDLTEKTRSGRSLRSPSGSYYFTVKINGTKNEWLKPDDVMDEGKELYRRFMSNKGDLNAELINASKMLPRIKALYECGYIRFRRIIKKSVPPKSLPHWFRLARDPETPLPDFSRVYDKKLGLKQNT